MVTFAPIREREGIAFAAIGLTDMLNCGGAVSSCHLQKGSSKHHHTGTNIVPMITLREDTADSLTS